MKKSVFLGGLAVALLGLEAAHGQGPTMPSGGGGGQTLGVPYVGGGAASGVPPLGAGGPTPPPGSLPPLDPYAGYTGAPPAYKVERGGPQTTPGPGTSPTNTGGLSSWLLYPHCPACCGPVGGDGPIHTEVYLRSGLSVPIGGGIFPTVLHTGWNIQGGTRILFFNPDVDRAWVVDLGVSNVNYNATAVDRTITLTNLTFSPGSGQAPVTVPSADVTVAGLNQTFFNVSLGREYYLWGQANSGELNWRWGFDVGGGPATCKADFDEIRHRTGTYGSMFIDVHTDWEYPCRHSIIYGGLRAEYRYSYSTEILQHQNDGDLQTINFLAELGIRF
jgi:hypothetical protein